MRTRQYLGITAAVVTLSLGAAACSSDGIDDAGKKDSTETTTTTTSPATDTSTQTIVEVASANSDFATLVSAVEVAGLVDTLSGTGPFTVFAPTNEAFSEIPAADLDAILADKAKLTAILTYHVVPGKVLAADLKPQQKVATVQGGEVDIEVSGGKATINGCNIVKTDIAASNGVIHVIDCVITPPAS